MSKRSGRLEEDDCRFASQGERPTISPGTVPKATRVRPVTIYSKDVLEFNKAGIKEEINKGPLVLDCFRS